MGTLTAYTSFSSTDGDDLDSDSVELYDSLYDSSLIQLTYYIEDIDEYLTYELTGTFYTNGREWYGTVSKLECLVNYAQYYKLTGSYSFNGWGSSPDIFSKPFTGDDTFAGSEEGDYFVYGKQGTDKFFGNGGNDYISTSSGKKGLANGGDGDDFILANGIGETITGGNGQDIVRVLSSGQKTVLSDFSPDDDTLEIALASNLSKLTDQFLLVDGHSYLSIEADQVAVGSGYKKALDANDFFIYNTATGYLYFDKDGNGKAKAVQLATFKSKPEFTAENISDCFIISVVGSAVYSGASDEYLENNTYGTI